MSYNVRFFRAGGGTELADHDPADHDLADHDLADHVAGIVEAIHALNADIVSLQEVTTVVGADIDETRPFERSLMEALSGYSWIRTDGPARLLSSNPILYRSDRFVPIQQGLHWFSDTPQIPDSVGWGNDLPRWATWAVFYDAFASRHLLVVNTHLDHVSRDANARAAEALVALIPQLLDSVTTTAECAVILTGDFNEAVGGALRTRLSRAAQLREALVPGDGASHRTPLVGQIDGILVSHFIDIAAAGVDRRWTASDHYPLYADLRLSSP